MTRGKFVYEPKGPHQVGAFDLLTPGDKETSVLARIFYPTDAEVGTGWPYAEQEYVKGTVTFMRWGSWLGRAVAWAAGYLRLCCAWKGGLLPGNQQLPLIVYSHGLGGHRKLYSSIYIELASHGFIVAAIEHRDSSGSMTFTADIDSSGQLQKQWLPYDRQPLSNFELRNTQVNHRAHECKRITQLMLQLADNGSIQQCISDVPLELQAQFQNRIDKNRIHIMGHSFGAATALTAVATDTEGLFKTCCAHDVWMHPLDPNLYNRVHKPTLFLHNENFHWETNVKRMKDVQATMSEGSWTNLTIRGTNHAAQSDAGLYVSHWLAQKFGLTGSLSPQLAIQLTARISLRFIDRHEGQQLSEEDEKLLNGEDPVCIPDFKFVPDGPSVTA